MDAQLIEKIVAEIEKRIRKPILLALTPALGYQNEIYQRLTLFSTVRFSLFVSTSAKETYSLEKWEKLGKRENITPETFYSLSSYHALFIPFLDNKLVGEIANGLLMSEESQLIHSALSQNIPIIALPYFCQPESELNEIIGLNKNKEYNLIIKNNIQKLTTMGFVFCSINDVEEYLSTYKKREQTNLEIKQKDNNRYITLNEVMANPEDYHLAKHKLTDSAIEYLKSVKK